MARKNDYVDLEGGRWDRGALDAGETNLLAEVEKSFSGARDWYAFENSWLKKLADFCRQRDLPMKEAVEQPLYNILRDLSDRLALSKGLTRLPDYRDDIEDLIAMHFDNRRAFCRATGLSEDMLSHVLAGRKHLAMNTLARALERIGYRLSIVSGAHARKPRTLRKPKAS